MEFMEKNYKSHLETHRFMMINARNPLFLKA